MPHGLLTVALATAMQVGYPSPSETPNAPALQNAYNQYGFEGKYEQRYPFDTQQNWVHGYHQEIPAYGGHAFFRPYNYKDVLSQSQTAAGWGMSPTMPYSQQFWHRYHDQATMLKLSQNHPTTHESVIIPQQATPIMPAGAWAAPVMFPAQPAMTPVQQVMSAPVYMPQPAQPQVFSTQPVGTVYPTAPR